MSKIGQLLLTSLSEHTNMATQRGASMMRQAAKEAVREALLQQVELGVITGAQMTILLLVIEAALDKSHIEDPLPRESEGPLGGGITGGGFGA